MEKVNFQVLFVAQGLNLTSAEVAETKISTIRALQMAAAKWVKLTSIIES